MAKHGAHHDRRPGLRVLLVGHACAPDVGSPDVGSPDVGSEAGLSWNWARHLKRWDPWLPARGEQGIQLHQQTERPN